jgi:hypothetical protein
VETFFLTRQKSEILAAAKNVPDRGEKRAADHQICRISSNKRVDTQRSRGQTVKLVVMMNEGMMVGMGTYFTVVIDK